MIENEMNRRKFLLVSTAAILGISAFESQVKLTATVLHFNKPNKNKRVYPLSLTNNFLKSCKLISERGLLGMLGNPEISATIQLSMVSHLITNLYVKDEQLIADIETLDTPSGRILRKLLDNPESVAFRTMGIGSYSFYKKGIWTISDNYKFVTINALKSGDAA